MSRRRDAMTEAKIARFRKEGRGEGTGVDYKPWLAGGFSSRGRMSRLLGRHNRRIHYLFSDIEKNTFLEYDWRDDVEDLWEQFPLDRDTTRLIAAEMGVRHPRDPRTRIAIVMTTDLVVKFRGGMLRPIACKASEELGNRRTKDKLEIERRYWKLLGRDWKLRTERSFCKVRSESLAYLHEYIDADRWHWVDPGYWPARSVAFLAQLDRWDHSRPFVHFAQAFDALPGFGPGDAVATMRYLACRKLIEFRLDLKFDHSAPIGRSILNVDSVVRRAA